MTQSVVEEGSNVPRRKARRPRSMRWKAYVTTWWMKMMARFISRMLRLKVTVIKGAEIPADGAVLVLGNHLSFLDPLLWCATTRRNGAMLAKAELWRNIFTMLLVRLRGDIPVARASDEGRDSALQAADVVLSHGGLVGGYPEGGINRPFWRTGLFTLARKYQAPIVLVRVIGTNDMLPSTKEDLASRSGRRFNRRAAVTIIYSDPIPYSFYENMTDVELATYARETCLNMAA